MRVLLAILLSAFQLFSFSAFAANWYVAPDAAGNGTIGSPGSLFTALAHTGWAASIAGADTVLLRAGTYYPGTGIVQMAFSGSAGNYVEWRNYPGENIVWDFPLYFQTRDYHRLKGYGLGFRITDRNKAMRADAIGYFDATTATNNEFVNLIIHDIPGAFTGFAGGKSVRGCIAWFIGNTYRHHFIYPYCRDFSGNLIGWVTGDVFEIGNPGSQGNSNIIYQTGVIYAVNSGQKTLLMSGGAGENQSAIGNSIWEYDVAGVVPSVGLHMQGGATNFVIAGNIIRANKPLHLNGTFDSATITGNVFATAFPGTYNAVEKSATASAWDWNRNSYFDVDDALRFDDNGNIRTFAQWQSATGFDANSMASNAASPASVTVYPNADEAKRAHIAIFNPAGTHNITVTVSNVLNVGDRYALYSAQNFNAGPIQSGRLSGTTISVPMTNLSVATILAVTNAGSPGFEFIAGTYLHQPTVTTPAFGAFVLLGSFGTEASGMTFSGGTLQ